MWVRFAVLVNAEDSGIVLEQPAAINAVTVTAKARPQRASVCMIDWTLAA